MKQKRTMPVPTIHIGLMLVVFKFKSILILVEVKLKCIHVGTVRFMACEVVSCSMKGG